MVADTDVIDLVPADGHLPGEADAPVVNSLPPDGTVVRAKRVGWDEELTVEQEFDLEPYGGGGGDQYGSDDLEGPLETSVGRVPGVAPFVVVLVGGQEADPATVTPTGLLGNVFCPTGPGGGVDATCSPHETGGQPGGVNPPTSNPHHTGAGIAAHVAANAGLAKFTQLHLDKIKALNPEGVKHGTFVTPKTATKENDQEQLAQLKKILPAGTLIKMLDVKGHHLTGGTLPPTSGAKVVGKAGEAGPKSGDELLHPAHGKFMVLKVEPGGDATVKTVGGEYKTLTKKQLAESSPTGPAVATGSPEWYAQKKAQLEAKQKSGAYTQAPTQPALPLPDPTHVKVLQTLPGSTAPKLVEDTAGHRWVMKPGAGKEPQVRNEATADAVYRALGVPTPHGGLRAAPDGITTKFTQFLEGAQTLGDWSNGKSKAEVAAVHKQLGKNFALDALLANWDVVGLTKDNVLVIDHGHGPVALRADNGGALLYRAQGAPKGDKFGKTVGELESLRDPKVNPSTAAVFKHLTDQDVAAQMKEVLANRNKIMGAVADHETRAKLVERFAYFEEKLAGGYGAPQPKPAKVAKPTGVGKPTTTAGLPKPKGSPSPALEAHAKETIAKWTPEELAAVQSYTGGGYSSLNSMMRQCPPQFDCLAGGLKTKYEQIESALAKAPPLPEPVDVLRKITIGHGSTAESTAGKFLAAARAARDSGNEYRMPSITSTTLKKSIGFGSEGPGGAKFLIRARTGVYVENVSVSQGEKELVQSSKARYRVVDVISEPGQTHIIHLEEVV